MEVEGSLQTLITPSPSNARLAMALPCPSITDRPGQGPCGVAAAGPAASDVQSVEVLSAGVTPEASGVRLALTLPRQRVADFAQGAERVTPAELTSTITEIREEFKSKTATIASEP